MRKATHFVPSGHIFDTFSTPCVGTELTFIYNIDTSDTISSETKAIMEVCRCVLYQDHSRFCENPSENHIRDNGVAAKYHTVTLDNLIICPLNIIKTDFRLGKITLFGRF
jgi:hypothetical protein